MSDRLTSRWTATAAEAYGPSGMKGRMGELLFYTILRENNLPARDFEEEKQPQVQGIDIETNDHTIDVKSNLVDGMFFIEVDAAGWLFNPKKTSEIIAHIDVASKEIVWYTREAARAKMRVADRLVKITSDNFRSDFMSRSWDDLFAHLRS